MSLFHEDFEKKEDYLSVFKIELVWALSDGHHYQRH